jgi:Kef-type K+ transport system membrane component KefB
LLRQTFGLSVALATTGIVLPIALSFVLLELFHPLHISALTAFTAGASLCSTSMGTTYAILSAAKLHSSRVGTVLVTAAMMDDVVGLVMVTVVSSLSTHVTATAIIRPILVSLGFLIGYMIATKLLKLFIRRVSNEKLNKLFETCSFGISGVVLLGSVAGAGYAGTSILFVGYLTGISANYLFPRHAIASYERYSYLLFKKS